MIPSLTRVKDVNGIALKKKHIESGQTTVRGKGSPGSARSKRLCLKKRKTGEVRKKGCYGRCSTAVCNNIRYTSRSISAQEPGGCRPDVPGRPQPRPLEKIHSPKDRWGKTKEQRRQGQPATIYQNKTQLEEGRHKNPRPIIIRVDQLSTGYMHL